MDVVCVLWSTQNLAIQEEVNREERVQLEHQAAKTSLLLFKVSYLELRSRDILARTGSEVRLQLR